MVAPVLMADLLTTDLFALAEARGDRPLFYNAGGDCVASHAELIRSARSLAGALASRGLEPGDRVVIHLRHGPSYANSIFAVWWAGGVVVPVHASLKEEQVEHVVDDAGAKLIVTEDGQLTELAARSGAGLVDPLARGPAPTQPDERSPSDVAAILYTSGSTGRPKGIRVSHANLLIGARIVSGYLGLEEDDRLASVLPFNFDYGLNQLLDALYTGASLVFPASSMAPHVLGAARAAKVTVLAGVPTIWALLAPGSNQRPANPPPSLRLITNSGGAFPKGLLEKYRKSWDGVDIHLMYGLSEAFRSTHLEPKYLAEHPGSMGKPIAQTEILVVDGKGSPVEAGEVGELVHAGPTVALGYHDNPDATAQRFRPHPLRPDSGERVVFSGDLVRRDSEGFLYFVGRSDQMIKTRGFRVSPEEVEELILATDLVDEVVVRGVEDPILGQAIEADVTLRGGSRDDRALRKALRRRAPPHLLPRRVRVRKRLPRTASGKVDRRRAAP